MSPTYKTAIEFVLKWEVGFDRNGKLRADGGYTDDPNDPGGETKWGISKRYHPNVDIKNLTFEDALVIYKQEYWDVYKTSVDLDTCRADVAVVLFDSGVNCGTNRALTWYRNTRNEEDQARAMLGLRKDFYIAKNNPNYLKGELNRLNDLTKLVDIIQEEQKQS